MTVSLKIHQYKANLESETIEENSFLALFDREDLAAIRDQLEALPNLQELFKNQAGIDFNLRKMQAYKSIRGKSSIRVTKTAAPVKLSSPRSSESEAALIKVRQTIKAIRLSETQSLKSGSSSRSDSPLSDPSNVEPDSASDSEAQEMEISLLK